MVFQEVKSNLSGLLSAQVKQFARTSQFPLLLGYPTGQITPLFKKKKKNQLNFIQHCLVTKKKGGEEL